MSEDGHCPDQCGSCCGYMTFAAPSRDPDYIEWLAYHGCTLTYRCGGWHVRVPIACCHLDEQGKCAVHDRRPRMCREYACEKRFDYTELIEFVNAKRKR